MDDVLPPEVVRRTPASASGSSKRRGVTYLPKAVFVYDPDQRAVVGGVVLTRCCGVAGQDVQWEATRAVAFAQPQNTTPDMFRFRGSVFRFTVEAELQMRSAPARVGGLLISHFPEFVSATWRAFTLKALGQSVWSDPSSAFVF